MARLHYKEYRGITLLARDLRKYQTRYEKILWEHLRCRRMMGYKFLRQHSVVYKIDRDWIAFYIPDFYCRELNLIIELDGGVHKARKEYDFERDLKLGEKGLSVFRLDNQEIEQIDEVLEKI